MEKIYIIDTHMGYEELLEAGVTKRAFKDKNECEAVICAIAESKYGKPKYSENSKYIKIVVSYWNGDISLEEAEEKLGDKKDSVFSSALYYDMKSLFWIKEYDLA